MLDFNPNSPAITKNYFWATYIPSRSNKFKLHANRGHALNAISWRNEGILYKWNLEKKEWEEIYRIEDGLRQENKCSVCNTELSNAYYYRAWVDKDTDNPKLAVFCREHYYKRKRR